MRLAAIAAALAFAGAANAQTVIYDTFNEDDQANLFDPVNTVPISAGRKVGTKDTPWIYFTVPTKTHITEIDVALSYASGADQFEVEVIGQHSIKHRFVLRDVPAGGQCCTFQAMTAPGIPVVPGIEYALHVRAQHDAVGGWNLNSAGVLGTYYVFHGHGKHNHTDEFDDSPMPAVRIIAQ